ncbi:MAG: DNA polymerase III subunit beta [Candidatus Tokpelaia sp.]|nr:MAG: DNA polymerase III subunit beta [Candidatus Tokpelaia sp.]KAA6207117.1 MAG: DNA polymerase III subunit beta [Candidatus Tokpelaia sp.]
MRIAVDRANLLRSLGRVHRIVERRNTVPILSNILIEASEKNGVGTICLKSTDLDLEVTEETAAGVEQPGATTIPAHLLYDIVRKLPEGGEISLSLDAEGKFVTLVSGRSNFRLETLPRGDFPELSAEGFSHSFTLPAGQLKYLIESTQFAVSQEETRYYLNGIYLHVLEVEGVQKLRAVATDGHRLACVEVEAPEQAITMPGLIIPRKTVGELQKLLSEMGEADITVHVSEAKIRLSMGAIILTSKLIDGVFPDYQRVIPLNNEKKLEVKRAEFVSAVDRVSTISTDRGRAVKLALAADIVTLTVHNPDSGTAEDKITASYDGDSMEIGFNSRYLLDIAGQIAGEDIVFMLADSGAPTLIRDNADNRALYVLMPMRV